MSALVLRGDARALPLPDGSVDLVVTSPPYFALRSYTDGGEHYEGQIGSEATPQEYIAALVACTREWVRVLKPSGSLWVNLGDKYARSGGVDRKERGSSVGDPGGRAAPRLAQVLPVGVQEKSLIGLPWRYALGCIDELGLILRAEIIWSKPNGLPESVTDRVRRSHEQWFHLTKLPRYFSAVDEIREPHTEPDGRPGYGRHRAAIPGGNRGRHVDMLPHSETRDMGQNPLGKLPGSVWEIATEPLRVPAELGVDHFAAFPTEWPRRIILGWSPSTVCRDCGFLLGSTYDSGMLGVRDRVRGSRTAGSARKVLLKGVRESEHRAQQEDDDLPATDDARVRRGVEAGSPDGAEERLPDGASVGDGRVPGAGAAAVGGCAPQERDQDRQPDRELGATGQGRPRPAPEARAQAVPMPSLRRHAPDLRDTLACPHCGSDRLEPARIVDPFGGTGTTALVADALGRHGISIDRSADYCRLAQWRTTDPAQRAKALGVAKPPAELDGQGDLLAELNVA